MRACVRTCTRTPRRVTHCCPAALQAARRRGVWSGLRCTATPTRTPRWSTRALITLRTREGVSVVTEGKLASLRQDVEAYLEAVQEAAAGAAAA